MITFSQCGAKREEASSQSADANFYINLQNTNARGESDTEIGGMDRKTGTSTSTIGGTLLLLYIATILK